MSTKATALAFAEANSDNKKSDSIILYRVFDFMARYGSIIAIIALWEIAAAAGWINRALLPPPSVIMSTLWNAFSAGRLTSDILISLQRSGLAFLVAALIGIPLGLGMGQFPLVERALDPILQFFRQTSALALYPVFIMFLGLGEASKVFVIFWATLFPILLSTIGGVKEVDRKLIEMAECYGATRIQVFHRVILPASLPAIFVGLRLSATMALLLLIAAEMIGANQGLGYLVMSAQYNFQIPLMFGAILILALLGLLSNSVLVSMQRRLCRWSNTK